MSDTKMSGTKDEFQALDEACEPEGVLKAYIKTMGCQMNENDSERIAGMLSQMGYGFVDRPEDADLILYNTCCVRENPERKVYGHIGTFVELKKMNPNLIIGICGCMVQQKTELERILQRLPHVDLIFGTHNLHRLPELLHRIRTTGERLVEVWDEEGDVVEGLPVQRKGNIKAFVTVIYGCTNFCSYCIVPYVRGKERSRSPKEILNEISQLAQDGYKEVTLLGQNVNSYGKDLDSDVDFAELLSRVNEIDGIERIRFTTSHPKDVSPRLIDAIADLPKVCEHLHLPVQAGGNDLLKRMNRGYDREYYLTLVKKIKERIPNISLTTDLIVGFPGETDEDFEATLDLVREVQYDSAFTFIYSPREGTPAAKMKNQVPEDVKKERIYRLIEVQNGISLQRNEDLVGEEVEVLIDGSTEDGSKGQGKTRTNKTVVFDGGKFGTDYNEGDLVTVRIETAKTWSLEGRLAE